MSLRSTFTKRFLNHTLVALALVHPFVLVGCGGPEYRPGASTESTATAEKKEDPKKGPVIVIAGGKNNTDSESGNTSGTNSQFVSSTTGCANVAVAPTLPQSQNSALASTGTVTAASAGGVTSPATSTASATGASPTCYGNPDTTSSPQQRAPATIVNQP